MKQTNAGNPGTLEPFPRIGSVVRAAASQALHYIPVQARRDNVVCQYIYRLHGLEFFLVGITIEESAENAHKGRTR